MRKKIYIKILYFLIFDLSDLFVYNEQEMFIKSFYIFIEIHDKEIALKFLILQLSNLRKLKLNIIDTECTLLIHDF